MGEGHSNILVYTCMNIGSKIPPNQVLAFLQENIPNKNFTLFHITFDPLNLPDSNKNKKQNKTKQTKTKTKQKTKTKTKQNRKKKQTNKKEKTSRFLENQCFQILNSNSCTRCTGKKTLFTFLFVCLFVCVHRCSHQYICVAPGALTR